MIRNFFHRLLLRRHFWRYATFSEVAELYTSRMLRMLAINIAAAFMSVFLYQNGYSIQFIAGFWALYYFVKIFMAFPAAQYAAKFGPKHGTLLSNILYIPAMLAFSVVPHFGLPAIIMTGLLQGFSTTMYNVCYGINFSKVKNIDHAGKELAFMNIFEKVATGISPLVGGLLAFVAGPQATMWAAAGLFAVAAVPLLRTGEPPKSRQSLVFRGFPWRLSWRSLVAESAIGFDVVSSGTVWLLFVVLAVLGITAGSDRVYADLGALTSVVLLAALAASYTYGKLIDRRQGGALLRATTVGNALVHLSRPFVQSVGIVAMINVTDEAATTGYTMAFTRGVFDTADLSGHRVTYLACIEAVSNIGATLASLLFLALTLWYGNLDGMRAYFFVAAAVALVIMTPKFHLYRR